jgi:hypothetical protein
MFITITLTTPLGSSVGPFDLFSNADSYAVAFDTNIPLSTLLSGYTVELPVGATIVRVQSIGTCTNYIDLTVDCTTTTTTTTIAPTTTTTSTTAQANCVTNFGAGMVPCIGGTLDDYMEAEVTLQNNVSVDTTFTMRVYYIPGTPLGNCNNTQSTIDIDVTVPAGQNTYLVTCGEAPFIDEGGATICSFELIDPPFPLCTPTTTTTTTAVVNCIQYQISTSSSFGISYSYIDCEGIEREGTLGGVGGFDSDTFCAQEGSVNSGGMTLVDQGPCETPTTTTTTTIAPTTTTTTSTTVAPTTTTTTSTTAASCNCITVDVLNTQLTDGGLDLYYILNDCGGGARDVNLASTIGTEVGNSTYFGLCSRATTSDLFKYGPTGDPFVGIEGMNITPNGTICTVDGDCLPVVPTTTTTTTIAPTTTTTTTRAPSPSPTTTTTTTVVDCNCITVSALDTQLTSGGQDLYYILNSCSGGNIDINLNETPGIEFDGSTYFGLCSSGLISDLFKYGSGGTPFEAIEGMTVTSNGTPCSENVDCVPVVPS